MLHLNVTAETPEELKKTLIQLAESLNLTSENVTPLPAPKRSKAKKAEPEAVEETPASFPQATAAPAPDPEPREETPVATVEAPAPTMEEARAALNKLRQAKGNAAVREILSKHGVSSFTDLPADEYAAVMEEAKV